jgi:two-component system chemotaxis response regulator CheY
MAKVLVVDDEVGIRETLKDVFEDEGFEVDLAADGVEGLQALRTRGPHGLVVLDLVMPKMDGAELIDAMRGDPALAGIPIILSTSHPQQAPSGVSLIRKPVDVNVLIDTVHRLLKRRIANP